MQVPTMGKPGYKEDENGQVLAYDATVWDWKWDGSKALGERESTAKNPKYLAAAKWEESTRPAILFEAKTGKVSFPLVKPHFGKRVMFPPNHNGAPWLDMIHQDENGERTAEPAKPGEHGRTRFTSGSPSGTTCSRRRAVFKGCRAITFTSTAEARTSPKEDGASSACWTRPFQI
jgi:hypothetical protein